MSFLSTLGRRLFQGKYAWVSNTLAGAGLFIVGDVIEQKLELRSKIINEYDTGRLTRIGLIGLFEGPPHYIFYKYLDQYLPGRSFSTIGKKILTDQLIACPMFSIQFFMGMSFLEGKSLPECWAEFKKKFPTVYLIDWLLWPPCQFINFYLIPNRYRVLYVNTVTVAWNVFLSYMKHYDQHEDEKPK
ncbi:unnamed protein product [Orchesella dallaii]|uniref:Mpv17-like protein 2 n=1 Tax=Orchesella dallaii TaxID=48710 RepID=A0ABP1QM58_9HEXA